MTTLTASPALPILRRAFRGMKIPKLRTIREFAEQEIVIPDGPFVGQRFRVERQPYTGLWFDAIDSALWQYYFATGPTQSGKTLSAVVIPAMWHLFEWQESVIVGVPNLDMKNDKWQDDFYPAIASSRYRDQLPTSGPGSRGGIGVQIRFRNGCWLRFMAAGGSDAAKAGKTARVLLATEIDSYDAAGEASKEADPVTQMLGRLRAHGDNARAYLECTTTYEEGRIWQETQIHGTATRIAMPCPNCSDFVTLGRANLTGWQDAETDLDARDRTYFQCPLCQHPWTEEDRKAATLKSVSVHKGQEIHRDGTITGPMPKTLKFGFRWSAPDNLLLPAGYVGVDEWSAEKSVDEDGAEKKLCQQVWALPAPSPTVDTTRLDVSTITHRQGGYTQGSLPVDAEILTAFMDLGKFRSHWSLVAWGPEATPGVVDYGEVSVGSDALGLDAALWTALREWREMMMTAYQMPPSLAMIDSGGTWTQVVYKACGEFGHPFYPAKGFGTSQEMAGVYRGPKAKTKTIRVIGDHYHVEKVAGHRTKLVSMDVDHWKSWAHERLRTPMGEHGAMTLFSTESPKRHREYAKHLLAEKSEKAWDARRGWIEMWKKVSANQPNHYLDTLVGACVAGHIAGARLDGNTAAYNMHSKAARGGKWFANQERRR